MKIQLYHTKDHHCGYFDERTARNLVLDPHNPGTRLAYQQALDCGFRRSGEILYRPDCPTCHACVSSRIPVATYAFSRNDKRCLKRNTDLVFKCQPAAFDPEQFSLYRQYLNARHRNAGMDQSNETDFRQHLWTEWSHTRFLSWYLNQALVLTAVTDYLPGGLSAIYTYFNPMMQRRSLGHFAILKQIQLAQKDNIPYVYLGYWISGHHKMDYKMRYMPEIYQDGVWQAVNATS